MLYMIGNIFLDGIRFNIVYNESAHENMTKGEHIVSHRVQKKIINLFKTEMDGRETVLCCHTNIYLSNKTLQILLVRTLNK